MRAAPVVFTLLLLLILPARGDAAGDVHHAYPAAVRDAPGAQFMAAQGLHVDAEGRIRMSLPSKASPAARAAMVEADENMAPFATPFPRGPLDKTSATLNCGNDNTISTAGTLVLQGGDAAGTAYPPVAGFNNLVIDRVRFGVLDFGASYPGTMFVDFWESTGPGQWDFVAGIDVIIGTNPGLEGDLYDVAVSGFDIVTNNELMVLVYDSAPGAGLILPAGDNSQSCFNGTDFCSVLLPDGGAGLFLYGIVDAAACPSGVNNIQLFELVLEVDYFLDSPTDAPSRSLGYALYDASPNPFNPRTSIRYALAEDTNARLLIYDLAGRLVRTLFDAPRQAGEHVSHWDGRAQDGSAVASGVYLYRLETPAYEETKRMILLK